jgi:hypothetical protein
MNILGHALLGAFDERATSVDFSDRHDFEEECCEFLPE